MMLITETLRAALHSFIKQPLRTLLALLGIATGSGMLALFVAFGLGMRDFFVDAGKARDATLLEMAPASMEFGLFKMDRPGILGGAALDEVTIQRVRHLPGVQRVDLRQILRVPLGARGGVRLFAREIYTDLMAEGLDEALLTQTIPAESLITRDGEVPIILSEQLISLYNRSVAETLHTPKLAKEALIGFSFELIVGRSMMMGSGGAKKVASLRGRIVGFSPYAMQLGITVPRSWAMRLEKEFRLEQSPPVYSTLFVKGARAEEMPALAQRLEALGLSTVGGDRRVGEAIYLATAALSATALLILLLAAGNVTYLFIAQIAERRIEFAIMRALGAPRRLIIGYIYCYALLIGSCGAGFGLLMARLFTYFLERQLTLWLAQFPLKPEHFFSWDLRAALLALACGNGAALLGGMIGAWQSELKKPIAQTLSVT